MLLLERKSDCWPTKRGVSGPGGATSQHWIGPTVSFQHDGKHKRRSRLSEAIPVDHAAGPSALAQREHGCAEPELPCRTPRHRQQLRLLAAKLAPVALHPHLERIVHLPADQGPSSSLEAAERGRSLAAEPSRAPARECEPPSLRAAKRADLIDHSMPRGLSSRVRARSSRVASCSSPTSARRRLRPCTTRRPTVSKAAYTSAARPTSVWPSWASSELPSRPRPVSGRS